MDTGTLPNRDFAVVIQVVRAQYLICIQSLLRVYNYILSYSTLGSPVLAMGCQQKRAGLNVLSGPHNQFRYFDFYILNMWP